MSLWIWCFCGFVLLHGRSLLQQRICITGNKRARRRAKRSCAKSAKIYLYLLWYFDITACLFIGTALFHCRHSLLPEPAGCCDFTKGPKVTTFCSRYRSTPQQLSIGCPDVNILAWGKWCVDTFGILYYRPIWLSCSSGIKSLHAPSLLRKNTSDSSMSPPTVLLIAFVTEAVAGDIKISKLSLQHCSQTDSISIKSASYTRASCAMSWLLHVYFQLLLRCSQRSTG